MVSKDSAADISWAVVENGLDFLTRAVAEMANDPADNKWAAIHLDGAIEVLIKARLIREDWTLVCKKAGAKLSAFKLGLLPTVSGKEGLDLLEAELGLTISQDQKDNVATVRSLRNRVTHFAVVGIDPAAVKVQLGRGLDFVVWFLEDHILPSAPADDADVIEEVLGEIRDVLGDIATFVAERLARLAPQLDAAETVTVCPQCAQGTLAVSGWELRCLFCSWTPGDDPEEVADEYVSAVLDLSSYAVIKDGGTWPVSNCPECGTNALVAGAKILKGAVTQTTDQQGSPETPTPEFLCFSCTFQCSYAHLTGCARCGEWTTNDFGMCPDCIEDAVRRE